MTQFEVKYHDLIDLSISSINLLLAVDTLEYNGLISMSREAIYSAYYCVRNSFRKAIDSLMNGSNEIEYGRHLSRGTNSFS